MNESERQTDISELKAALRRKDAVAEARASINADGNVVSDTPWLAELDNAGYAMATNLGDIDNVVDDLESSIRVLEQSMGIPAEVPTEPAERQSPDSEADLPRILEAVRQHGLELGAEMHRLRALSDRLRVFRMRFLGEDDQPQLQREEAGSEQE